MIRPSRAWMVACSYLVIITFGVAQLAPLGEAAEWLRPRPTGYNFAMTKELAQQVAAEAWPPERYAAVNAAYDRYLQRFDQVEDET